MTQKKSDQTIATRLDFNRLALLIAVLLAVTIAAFSGYRLEIGANGLTFEKNQADNEIVQHMSDQNAATP